MIIHVVGGGLAGSEAALAAASGGVRVVLHEMRPHTTTPAHKSDHLAELVCSNSLGSIEERNGKGLLKKELEIFGSNLLEVAKRVSVPAGKALAVDRWAFQTAVTELVYRHKNIEIKREEMVDLPEGEITVVATGPLTSEALSGRITEILGEGNLYFYDAISPIVEGDSLDIGKGYFGNRYGGGEDYLNFPLTEEEFNTFFNELVEADSVTPRPFEDVHYFNSCMPVEEIARRGKASLLFGPMRPVGLEDPRTGKIPFAVVQLRKENAGGTMYNLVGFQTRLTYGEQKRVLKFIPGLWGANYLRYGSIHRNSYINSPSFLLPTLEFVKNRNLLFAGQLCGVEGYVESISSGMVAGINGALKAKGEEPLRFPVETMTGALLTYISTETGKDFQPINANYGLIKVPGIPHRKKERRGLQAANSLEKAREFKDLYFKYHPLCVN